MASVGLSNGVLVIASLMVVATLMLLTVFARLYRKAGPHEALVVYGFRGTRIVKGRGTVIFPMIENWHELSLELMSFDVAPQQDLYTRQGVAVTVEAVAQIKVKSDPESILTAAEQFLTKSDEEREGLIRLVMEGHLRGIIGQLTVEEIVKQPEMVGDRMRATCADDMNKMGLEVISFTIKEVRDKNEYITNMGRPDIARIKRDADVAGAEAERDTAIKRAGADRHRAEAGGDRAQAYRDARRGREAAAHRRGRGPRGRHPHAGSGGGRDHLQEGRGRGQGHEREGRGIPGLEPGRGRRSAHRRAARRGAGPGCPARQRRQDHDRVDRGRRGGRDEQDHRRPDQDGGADPRPVRDALGHADVRAVREDQDDRREERAPGDPVTGGAAVVAGKVEAMSLLERVTTLVRANLNDLIDQAEDPEKLLKQVILDMENQLLQVKTQVAIAIADEHVLERKRKEYEERVAEWTRRAGAAGGKKKGQPGRAPPPRPRT